MSYTKYSCGCVSGCGELVVCEKPEDECGRIRTDKQVRKNEGLPARDYDLERKELRRLADSLKGE